MVATVSHRSSTFVAAVLAGVAPAQLAGCGYGSSPLGGPYGGTASSPPPSPEDSSTGPSDGSASGGGADASAGSSDSATITAPMTWSEIFNSYLAAGTIGNCTDASCHNYPTPRALYAYLQDQG